MSEHKKMVLTQVEQIFEHYPECLVHPVSCTGVSHDGFSKQLKKSYPDYFQEYTRFSIRKKFVVGEAYFFELNVLFGVQYIATLTIKNNWQERVTPDIMKRCLNSLFEKCVQYQIKTLGMPIVEGAPIEWLKKQFENTALKNSKHELEQVLFFLR